MYALAEGHAMMSRADSSQHLLPIIASVAGINLTALSASFQTNAAQLWGFLHTLLGLIGILYADSDILSVIAYRIALGGPSDATKPAKAILVDPFSKRNAADAGMRMGVLHHAG